MLFILLKSGNGWYALDTRPVVEVTPRVELRPCPGAPAYLAGLLRYRGTCVPVIDFSRLVNASPAPANLGCRILLLRYASRDGRERLLGLMAEAAIETVLTVKATPLVRSDFNQDGVSPDALPCLGRLTMDDRGLVQRIDTGHLLTAEAERILFPEAQAYEPEPALRETAKGA